MKRFISVILLLAIAANAAGFIIAFHINRESCYTNAMADIKSRDSEDAVILKINLEPDGLLPEDLERIKAHEIRYKGRMYDISREFTRNDTLFIYCLPDEEEDDLIAGFVRIIDDLTSEKKKNPVNNTNPVKLINFETNLLTLNLPVPVYYTGLPVRYITGHYKPVDPAVPHRPPELT
ncbi:MAG TPA: hypothetical protein VHP30_07855 [Ignavibacteriales bacterium]|nr:hypothetical protein [Ignavibacteriales bacterium]